MKTVVILSCKNENRTRRIRNTMVLGGKIYFGTRSTHSAVPRNPVIR